jgi:hypothetical protein
MKGRQIERTSNANSPIVAPQLRDRNFLRSNRCELYLVSLSPFQGRTRLFEVPGVETLA